MTTYAGWVPTITGQLSFSLIGLRAGDSGYLAANRVNDSTKPVPHRTIVVLKRRVTKDVPWPFRLAHPQRIKTCVLLGGTTAGERPVIKAREVGAHIDDIGKLVGQIIVVPYHVKGLEQRLAKKCVADLKRMISSLPHEDAAEDLVNRVHRRITMAERAGVRVLKCDYELYRTGEVRIETEAGLRPEFAQQMYYFLKDCAHRHYHHERSSDNLLPLVPAPVSDDISWRRDTLWCLARSVLEARRRDSLRGYKSAIGMLAYADAFQALLGRVHRPHLLPVEFSRIPNEITYDFAHTKSSLESKIAEKESAAGSTREIGGIILGSTIGLAALWTAAVQIKEQICSGSENLLPKCEVSVPAYMAEIVRFVIEQPPIAFGGIVLLLSFAWAHRLLRAPWVKTLQAFLHTWSQATGASVSRIVADKMPSYSDAIGAVSGSITSVLLGGLGIGAVYLLRYLVEVIFG